MWHRAPCLQYCAAPHVWHRLTTKSTRLPPNCNLIAQKPFPTKPDTSFLDSSAALHWLSLYMSQRQNSLLIRQRWWTMKKLLENRYWRLWPMKCHSAQKIGGDGGKQSEKLWRPWTLVGCPSPVPPCNSTVEDFLSITCHPATAIDVLCRSFFVLRCPLT